MWARKNVKRASAVNACGHPSVGKKATTCAVHRNTAASLVIHQEVKFVERLNIREAMEQAAHDAAEKGCGDIPIVAHKKSHAEWLVTMKASDWFKLYREWECGRQKGKQEG